MLILPVFVFVQPDALTLEHAGGNLWVVVDDLPENTTPSAIYRLFTFLDNYIENTPDSPMPDLQRKLPVVIRFVPQGVTDRAFPEGTEGFAGLVGLANWRCAPDSTGHNRRHCRLWCDDDAPDNESSVILAVIRVQADPDMTAGYLAHELSHIQGAVDGPACPASQDYNPLAQREPDCQDAYWWYGVTGFFDLKPSGIVWEALNGRCAGNERQDICFQLANILENFGH